MLGVALAGIITATPSALASNIRDAATCDTVIVKTEKNIVRATVTADDLNTLISLADQAKSACSKGDFAMASKLTTAIETKLKQVATQ